MSLISPLWTTILARIGLVWLLLAAMESRAEVVAPPPTTALQWLTDMRHAVSTLNYKGVVAYVKEKQVDSFQIYHASNAGVEQERLVSINSPLREVIRSAGKVTCYFPERKAMFIENKPSTQSSLLQLPEDLTRLTRHYRVGLQGQEYVAQRLARVVSIDPRDDYRYARLIWIDEDSKLPLKFELLDEEEQTLEEMVFTSLSVEHSIPATDLNPSVAADSFSRQVGEREVLPLGSLHWTLQNVPEGFQIVSYDRLKRQPSVHTVDHILLSDGVASVSVYIEEQKSRDSWEHPRQIGATHAHALKIDDFLITVMGEVPAKTVQAIAKGLRHREEP